MIDRKGFWAVLPPLARVDPCHFCERREAEMNVDFEGRIVGCCETCWERAEDELDDALLIEAIERQGNRPFSSYPALEDLMSEQGDDDA